MTDEQTNEGPQRPVGDVSGEDLEKLGATRLRNALWAVLWGFGLPGRLKLGQEVDGRINRLLQIPEADRPLEVRRALRVWGDLQLALMAFEVDQAAAERDAKKELGTNEQRLTQRVKGQGTGSYTPPPPPPAPVPESER